MEFGRELVCDLLASWTAQWNLALRKHYLSIVFTFQLQFCRKLSIRKIGTSQFSLLFLLFSFSEGTHSMTIALLAKFCYILL